MGGLGISNSCACFVIEGGVYFVCEWEVCWVDEDNAG